MGNKSGNILRVKTFVVVLCGFQFLKEVSIANAACHISTSRCLGFETKGWYNEGTVYKYSFETVQNSSVTTPNLDAPKNRDDQSLSLYGTFEVSKAILGPEMAKCGASIRVTELKAKYTKIRDEEMPAEIEGPIDLDIGSEPVTFPFNIYGDSANYADNENIVCAPEDEAPWKTNFKRSLAFQLMTWHGHDSTKEGPNPTRHIIEHNYDTFGSESGPTHLLMWKKDSISKIRLHSQNSKNADKFVEISKSFDYNSDSDIESRHAQFISHYEQAVDDFANFGLTSCLQTLTDKIVSGAVCSELQRTASQRDLFVETNTVTKIELIEKVKGEFKPVTNAKMVKERFDPLIGEATKSAKVLSDFGNLLGKLANFVDSPKSLMAHFANRLQRILPLIPTRVLNEEYQKLKGNSGVGKLFLEFVAATRSDDAVEFMIKRITEEDPLLEEETFDNFLWQTAFYPSARYADDRAITAMTQLLTKTTSSNSYFHEKYGMSNSTFLLQMATFMNQIKIREDLASQKTVDNFYEAFNNYDTNYGDIDRGTIMEIQKIFTKSATLRRLPTAKEFKANDFELLKRMDPCNSQNHESFIKNLMEDKNKESDIKIAAYLFMRKCYNEDWRKLVKNFVEQEDSDEEVKRFIFNHIEKISEGLASKQIMEDEEILALAPTNSTPSSFGVTLFDHRNNFFEAYDPRVEVQDSEMSWQINVIKGASYIPRMIVMECRFFLKDGNEDYMELEILRSESDGEKHSTIYSTIRLNGLPFYTNAFELDMDLLWKLFEENSDIGLKHLVETIGAANLHMIKKLMKNPKVEMLRFLYSEKSQRQFPTLSGLPIKSGNEIDVIFGLNFTHHLDKTQDSELTYKFLFQPSFVSQHNEEISLGLGETSEVSGFRLHSGSSLGLNFALVFHKTKEGDVKIQLQFSKEGSPNSNAFEVNADILEFKQFLYTDSFTKYEESDEHIWTSFEDNGLSIERLPLQGVMSGGECVYLAEMQGFMERAPFYLTAHLSCKMPTLNLEISKSFYNSKGLYVDIKLEPDNFTEESKRFQARAGLMRYPETYSEALELKFETPETNHELNVTSHFRLPSTLFPTNGFSVSYKGDEGKKYGVHVYSKKIYCKNDSEDDCVYLWNYRKEFGVKAWTPIPGWEKLTLLDGLIRHGNGSTADPHRLWLQHEGLHPYLNSELNVLLNHELETYPVKFPLNGLEEVNALPSNSYRLSLEAENEYLGSLSLKNNLHYKEYITGNTNHPSAWSGSFEIAYTRKGEWHTVDGNYSQLVTTSQGNGWKNEKRGNVAWSQFPSLDMGILVEERSKSSDGEKADGKCGEDSFEETMLEADIQMKNLKDYFLRVNYENVRSTKGGCGMRLIDVELSPLAQFTLQSQDKDGVSQIQKLESGLFVQDKVVWLNYEFNEKETNGPQLVLNVRVNGTHPSILYGMDHGLTKTEGKNEIDYIGKILVSPPGYEINLDGTLQPVNPKSWLIYKGFDVKVKDKKWRQPVSVSFNTIPDESSLKQFKLLAKDTSATYFDSSVKFLKEASPEGYILSAKANSPHLFDIKADYGGGLLRLIGEAPKQDVKFHGKLTYGQVEPNVSLTLKGVVTRIKNPKFVLLSLDSTTDAVIGKTPSKTVVEIIKRYFPGWQTPPSIEIISTTKVSNIDVENWFNITIRNVQEEVRSAAFEFQSKLADESYHIRYDRQALYKLGEEASSLVPKPFMIWGDWLHIDVPSCRKFNFDSIFNVYHKEGQSKEGDVVTFVFGADIEHKFKLDLDQGMRNYNSTVYLSRRQDVHTFYNGTKKEPTLNDVERFLKTETSAGAEIKFSGSNHDVNTYSAQLQFNDHFLESRNKSHTLTLTHTLPHIVYRSTFSINRTTELFNDSQIPLPNYLLSPPEHLLNTVEDNSIYTKHCLIALNVEQENLEADPDNSDDSSITTNTFSFVKLSHHFKRYFVSWRNFDFSVDHDIHLPFLGFLAHGMNIEPISWEDRLQSKNPSENNGYWSLTSSKLFGASLTKNGNEYVSFIEIVPIYVRTKVEGVISYFYPNKETSSLHFSQKVKSVLFDESLAFDVQRVNKEDEEITTNIVFAFPGKKDGNITSKVVIKSLVDDEHKISADYVTHDVFYEFGETKERPESLDFKSLSTKIMNSEGIPILLHYSFVTDLSIKSFLNSNKNKLETFNFLLATTAPGQGEGKPQVVQLRLEKTDDERAFERFVYREMYFRNGELSSNGNCRSGSGYGPHADKLPITGETLNQLVQNAHSCDRCISMKSADLNSTSLQCGISPGYFLLRSAKSQKELDNPLIKSIPWESQTLMVNWAKDGSSCSANVSRNFFIGEGENKEFSEDCAPTLKHLSPCFMAPNGDNCEQSVKQSQIELWKKVSGKFNPAKVTLVVESFLLTITSIFEGASL